MTLATPPFGKILRDHVRSIPGNMHVKFDVRSFNRFKLVWLTGPLRTDTHTHTHRHTTNENSISAIHSVHLTEIMNSCELSVLIINKRRHTLYATCSMRFTVDVHSKMKLNWILVDGQCATKATDSTKLTSPHLRHQEAEEKGDEEALQWKTTCRWNDAMGRQVRPLQR